jgi:hypothetical protein
MLKNWFINMFTKKKMTKLKVHFTGALRVVVDLKHTFCVATTNWENYRFSEIIVVMNIFG